MNSFLGMKLLTHTKFLLILLATIHSSVVFSQTSYPDIYLTRSHKGIIYGKTDNPFCKKSAFDPKRDEIDEAEKYIRSKVDSLTNNFNNASLISIYINKKFENYKRQYFGCLQADNKKVLRINFDYVEDLSKIDWNFKDIMLFEDGWDNHWTVEINLNTKELIFFSVNSKGG
jgi:hypothetical protein